VAQFWLGPAHALEIAALISLLTALATCGLARAWPRLSTPQRAALVVPLALYPLIHYVVGYEERYRIPLEGILLLLAGACAHGKARSRDATPMPSAPAGPGSRSPRA
jgi:hypothetical protein